MFSVVIFTWLDMVLRVRLTSKGESNGAETKRWSYNW
jgi:hypothetical protein